MAKIPTSRIILYVILGIIVIVVGVWVIRTRSQEAKLGKRVVAVEDIPKEVRRLTRNLDKLAPYLSRLSAEDAARAQELVQKARTAIDEFQTLTDPDQLTSKREEIMDYIAQLRKFKRIALKGK
jgi:outer membrane murein-binding lipoprotein Lpp